MMPQSVEYLRLVSIHLVPIHASLEMYRCL